MAKIYLSYSHKDVDFARLLTEKLRSAGHEVLGDAAILPGQDWRSILYEGLKSADVFIVLLSESSLSSKYTLTEVGSARAYASHIGKPIVIPVLIDDLQIPLPLQDIQILFAKDRNTDHILTQVNRALSISAAREEVKKQKIKSTAGEYIRHAIDVQKKYESNNRIKGEFWNIAGFIALLVGIGFALATLHTRPKDENWRLLSMHF